MRINRRIAREEAGVTAVEYGIIIALVIVGSISLILLTGQGLNSFFRTGSGNLSGAAACQAGTPGCSVVPTLTPTSTPTPTPSSTATPTPTSKPSAITLSGSVAKSSKNTPSMLSINVLQGVVGASSLDVASVSFSSGPPGAQGAGATATSAGTVSFTAPTNKSGTFTVAFTYSVGGVTVQGSTIVITVP